MRLKSAWVVVPLLLLLFGCEIPQVMRPLRLYDLGDGTKIEVFLQRTSPNNGRLVSASVQGERFEGEIVVYGAGDYMPRPGQYYAEHRGTTDSLRSDVSLPDLYGFGKDANTRPAGTAILVGNQGTTIEIVLYRISSDLQYGDGVARDNKGRHYRVFLSTES